MKGSLTTLFLVLTVLSVGFGSSTNNSRAKRRIHLPFFGIGPYCTGCPAHFCDDDPAIIHGYCCGCASMFDNLPIKCPNFINCPLNGKDLCEKYEYMMHCCCES